MAMKINVIITGSTGMVGEGSFGSGVQVIPIFLSHSINHKTVKCSLTKIDFHIKKTISAVIYGYDLLLPVIHILNATKAVYPDLLFSFLIPDHHILPVIPFQINCKLFKFQVIIRKSFNHFLILSSLLPVVFVYTGGKQIVNRDIIRIY